MYFKTPKTSKGGDITWRYDDFLGIWIEDGICFIEKAVEETLGIKLKSRNFAEAVKIFQVATYTDPEAFAEDENSFVIDNGQFNLETLTLETFNPESNHKNRLPVKYDPLADCSSVKKFITEIAPGDEATIQELFGYLLVKKYFIQKCFIFVGKGANGKSTLLKLMEAFVGRDNTSALSLFDLTTARFSKAELYNKLANLSPDIGADELKKTGIFKALTGGDTINAEKKNQHPFKFTNYAKLIFSCNQLPVSPDISDAFFRRFIILKFNQVFDEEHAKQQDQLLAELTTPQELSGLLNWALEGLKRLRQNGAFTQGQGVEAIKSIYLDMSDPITAFVNQCTEDDMDAESVKDVIFKAYRDFCINRGIIPRDSNVFFKQLRGRIYIQDTQITVNGIRVRAYKGIKLKGVTHPAQVAHRISTPPLIQFQTGVIEPVHPVHPVLETSPSPFEKVKVVADLLVKAGQDGTKPETFASALGWEVSLIEDILKTIQRDGHAFNILGKWRWVS